VGAGPRTIRPAACRRRLCFCQNRTAQESRKVLFGWPLSPAGAAVSDESDSWAGSIAASLLHHQTSGGVTPRSCSGMVLGQSREKLLRQVTVQLSNAVMVRWCRVEVQINLSPLFFFIGRSESRATPLPVTTISGFIH
jgi:hypothetical protein